jgi:hypothetical protein
MQTPETDAKAEAVRHFLVGKNVVVPEHHYRDESRTPADARDRARLRQREWYYRYLLQDKSGATEIRVTFDAMRDADVDTLGLKVLEGRRRKARGEAGTVWVEMAEGQPTVSLAG